MNKLAKRLGCLFLSAITAFSLVACGDDEEVSSSGSSNGGTPGVDVEQKYDTETRPVVFSTQALDGNFNPFFATSGTDTTIIAVTQVGMLTTDALGNPACGQDEDTVALDYTYKTSEVGGKTYTDYSFIIKNGMKFSDGQPLDIDDVLFNLYVYLDPAYMGSATIYSTDIVGLQAYRAQDPTANEELGEEAVNATFYADADQRIIDMRAYLDSDTTTVVQDQAQVNKDVAKMKELFLEEVQTDWTNNAGSIESYEKEYRFTQDWEIFYYVEGLVAHKYTADDKMMKDTEGKYLTALDDADNMMAEELAAQVADQNKIAAAVAKYGCTAEEAKEYVIRDSAIQTVYESYTLTNSGLLQVLNYWQTGANLRDELMMDAKSEYIKNLQATTGLKVKSISGITTSKTSTDFKGNALGAEHDVLNIKINGVDPKAIWNFAFTVAPMHYYAGAERAAKANRVDYFGVEYGDKNFFDKVLQDPAKNGLPVGAGPYMASDETGSATPIKDTFYRNNWVYYVRNPHFSSMGTGLSNAKIKYMRYKVVSSDKLMQALEAKDIDFGEPNATQTNINAVKGIGHLAYQQYQTNGYGYVGINPKYVPDIEVRRAIMMAMNTSSIIKNYYTDALASVLYRSMSITNWAYPDGVGEYYTFTTNKDTIINMVKSAGWTLNSNNKFEKDGKLLKLTFTIAGETTDHPAFDMFRTTATFLNQCGFDVTVVTDVSALKKLATGGLAVWAAAWSSTIDPDLYQVYHKDSNATSVKNWGYPTIMADTTGQFDDEKIIIDQLSAKIEEAREVMSEEERAPLYAEALDMIMELAVELPTYQRNDLVVYNKDVIDVTSLNQNATANSGVVDKLWEINYN